MAWVFPIVQSYKFKSKSQQKWLIENARQGVPDSSKLQIQKQITTRRGCGCCAWRVFPIVQSYKFKSKSQRIGYKGSKNDGVPDSSKLQIQKQITTMSTTHFNWNEVFPIVQSYKFNSKSQPGSGAKMVLRRCSQ